MATVGRAGLILKRGWDEELKERFQRTDLTMHFPPHSPLLPLSAEPLGQELVREQRTRAPHLGWT